MKYTAAFFLCFSLIAQQRVPRPVVRTDGSVNPVEAPLPEPVKPEDKCSLEGTVTSGISGEPLKKAHLSLRPLGAPNGVPYGAVTDGAGHFLIEDVDPGRYFLSASRNGFVTQPYSPQGNAKRSTTLTLGNGQHLKEVIMKMTPQGVIAGRILDEDGEPLANVMVQTMMYAYQRGKRQLVPGGGGSTNDLGDFRIHGLRPGKYLISASFRGDMSLMQPERIAPGQAPQAEEGYATTYYPNTTKPDSASQLEVTPGAQMLGLNMTLARTRTVRVKGHIVGLGDMNAARRTNLSLFPHDSFAFMGMPRAFARVNDAKGTFEFRGVAPGSYLISADMFDDNKRFSARVPVEVGNANVEDVEIRLQAPADLSGRIVIEDNGDVKGAGLNVFLQPRSNLQGMGGGGGPIKEDLTFKLNNIGPDPYEVNVFGLPESFYVRAVRLGTQDVTDTGVDFTNGVSAEELTVVISPNGGQVEGTVQNAKGENAAGSTVTLIPDVTHRSINALYKTANTDQNGHFTIRGVRPGEYTIYAWEEIESGAYQDPDFLKPHESSATTVSVKASGHDTLQLKAVPAENSANPNAAR